MTDTTPVAVERFTPDNPPDSAPTVTPDPDGDYVRFYVRFTDYAALSAQLEAANQRAEMLADSVAKAWAEGKAEGLREAAASARSWGTITQDEYDLDGTRWNFELPDQIATRILALIPAPPAEPSAGDYRQGFEDGCSHMKEDYEAGKRIEARVKAEPAQTVQDSFSDLIESACAEAELAMRKFPQPNYVLLKVAEEAGEVVKASVHFAEGRETRENVEAEMRQAIAMLYRLWVEGDEVNGVPAIAGGKS